MRRPFDCQLRLDASPVLQVPLNTNCRAEIVPILKALQFIYSQPELRDSILELIRRDINGKTSACRGRTGLDYWQILVLAAVRLGLNADYDALQDLAENHRALRQVMGIGNWDEKTSFDWRRIRDNLCGIRPETIEQINHLVVGAGHELVPEAPRAVRGDSFAVETNIHYPTESGLILDGLRVLLRIAPVLAALVGADGWRQHNHLLKQAQQRATEIRRISRGKGPGYRDRLADAYGRLIKQTELILSRAAGLAVQTNTFLQQHSAQTSEATALLSDLCGFLRMTEQICDTARRRVLEGESVPHSDKLFSLFEVHTQLYRRGKVRQENQFGRLVLVIEDAAGFVCHYKVLERTDADADVLIEQMRTLQQRLQGRIERASFDRGFHSPENQRQLAEIVKHPCLPMRGVRQTAEQERTASVKFRQSRKRHPGIESAIGALQSGNGQTRCRDRTERGFQRYVGLGVLGRNLHVLGKLLLQRQDATSKAAFSKRRAA